MSGMARTVARHRAARQAPSGHPCSRADAEAGSGNGHFRPVGAPTIRTKGGGHVWLSLSRFSPTDIGPDITPQHVEKPKNLGKGGMATLDAQPCPGNGDTTRDLTNRGSRRQRNAA